MSLKYFKSLLVKSQCCSFIYKFYLILSLYNTQCPQNGQTHVKNFATNGLTCV